MRSPKLLMAVAVFAVAGALVFAAVYALLSVLFGGSTAAALPGGVAFMIVFLPVFWFMTKTLERRHQRRLGVSAEITPSMDTEPVCVAEGHHVSSSVDSTAATVEDWMVALNGQPRRETSHEGSVRIVTRLGSRFVVRMFGINTSRGRRALPMSVDVTVRADGDERARLAVTACSDAGWYLFRLPSFEAEYRQALEALVAQLKEALRQ